MAHQKTSLDHFQQLFGTLIELSSVALGGEVTTVSDEFFAEASNLLKVEPAPSLKGQFGPKGALYSGWESRRHNPNHDWCIIKLGAPGYISGFDIDTSHFNGNEAPEASVQAIYAPETHAPSFDDFSWTELLPKVGLDPNSPHLYQISGSNEAYTHVKLNIFPDGGVARFRVYGIVKAIFPKDGSVSIDLAHVLSGGRVVFTSDQHFGIGSNILLPGRGEDMGDGWETKRSRVPGHKDWVVVRLGAPGNLEHAEIDTAHFMGNFPESCEIHGVHSNDVNPATESNWVLLLPQVKLGPHRRHFFQLENVHDKIYTHVRLTIYPDGGVKRLRILGRRAQGTRLKNVSTAEPNSIPDDIQEGESTFSINSSDNQSGSAVLPALPLTPEAFLPFGQVIQAWADHNAAPPGVKVTPANQGSAIKFHKLSLIQSSYPEGSFATSGISVFRCKPLDSPLGDTWAVRVLERHPYTNQAFIPMGVGVKLGDDVLETPGKAYLVVVALNGTDDGPDLKTLRVFVAHSGQGVVYGTGIWHHPMVSLETVMDFACVETQVGNGDAKDCEILQLDSKDGLPFVKLPIF
ncbi:allantoicase [Rickenella mellea]|uniref:Allantoicase n=1 Tax=Rickenella mellea TaxID=50990 RepID=A0A4Y7QEY6_9AGAM|nr:allantoicase [Rickenella mellea]